MIIKEDINIRKTILHVLDTEHGNCTLSNSLLEISPDLYDFIQNHIYKIMISDDAKNCEFETSYSPIYPILTDLDESDEDSFIDASRQIAEHLYDSMSEGTDIPPADLLIVSFDVEGILYLAMLKMNYKESYVHEINDQGDTQTEIIKNSTLLPSSGTQMKEAIVIDMDSKKIKMLEKRYEINGEKVFYLSERFLVCHTGIAPKKKLQVVNRTINSILDKYEGQDIKARMDAKRELLDEYEKEDLIDVEQIGNRLFGNSPERKEEYDEKMEKYDLQYDKFELANESTERVLRKQTFVTDSGIEITVPMEAYNKTDFEVSDERDGTSTITIRNIYEIAMKNR